MAKTDNVENAPEITQEQLRKENEYIIKNKRVRRQSRRRAVVIILLVFLLIVALLAGATYAIMQFVDESNFRVTVSHTGTAWLSLSKDYEFTNPTSVLDISAPKNMDNCTLCNYLDHKLEEIYATNGAYDGEGSKEYFIATSFYLKNTSNEPISYREIITLGRTMKGMEKAIRVMVIKDIEPPDDEDHGVVSVYAAPQSDNHGKTVTDENGDPVREEVVPPGGAMLAYKPQPMLDYKNFSFDPNDFDEEGVWLAKPFLGNGYVMNSELYPLEVGQIVKYTVIIWLEGQDPQCVDAILGGQVKLSVEFSTN
ncbi:MAG TPA: hypothetical protein DCG79_00395 [Clostridiales bacterium]|nr:hypothetical protein [Clostridiales bacterium]